jgi:pimeloyl-ACP methyl ester carboxylesterase
MSDPTQTATRVVLVHGSWADGSSWSRVIPTLQRSGLDVAAVQLPLTSFDEDVDALHRVLAASEAPTVLVGHSYGGAVISAADDGVGDVRELVFVAASAPDAGEPLASLMTLNSADGAIAMRADEDGYVWAADAANFQDVAAQDLPLDDARLFVAVQKPIHSDVFAASLRHPAWRRLPSRYVVAANDRLFSPTTQRHLATRMGASLIELGGSHMLIQSAADAVAGVIVGATVAKTA